jgi:LDH2 family malate/lactate/ureidoglycolate dehydrogenase
MAGHKGYGFGLWCELLSAILPGGRSTWDVGSWIFDPVDRPSWHNASFTLYDVAAIAGQAAFDARLNRLIDEIHSAPAADGVEKVILPGEREWACYHRSVESGIELPPDVTAKLREASALTCIKSTWLDQATP